MYEKQTWSDRPDTSTPQSAARFNHMESGIEAAHLLAEAGGGGEPEPVVTPEPLEVLTGSRYYSEGSSFSLVTDEDTPVSAVLLLIQTEDWGAAADMPVPEGTGANAWSLIASADRGTNATHMKLWTRTVVSPGAQTLTVRQSTGGDPGEFYAALYVLPPGSVILEAEAATGQSSTTHTGPLVNATNAHQLVISAWMKEWGGTLGYGTPPGTERSRASEIGAGDTIGTLLTATTETTGPDAVSNSVESLWDITYVAATILVSSPNNTGLTEIDELRSQIPSLEDLEQSAYIGAVGGTLWPSLAAVNFDQRIAALSLVNNNAITASDTSYWTVELVRWRTGTSSVIASRTTQTAAPNGGMSSMVPWTFDLMAFTSAQFLQKGDALGLKFTKTGTPTALAEVAVSWRYEPGVTA